MSETPDELRTQAEDLRDHFTGDHCNCMSAEEAADVIDALLARLATAEAERDEARIRLATKEAWIETWITGEAVARREQP